MAGSISMTNGGEDIGMFKLLWCIMIIYMGMILKLNDLSELVCGMFKMYPLKGKFYPGIKLEIKIVLKQICHIIFKPNPITNKKGCIILALQSMTYKMVTL